MQQITTFITDEQRNWLIDNSISISAQANGREGKIQAQHIRDALDRYIKEYGED